MNQKKKWLNYKNTLKGLLKASGRTEDRPEQSSNLQKGLSVAGERGGGCIREVMGGPGWETEARREARAEAAMGAGSKGLSSLQIKY